jgi:hypothetical protein
MRITNYELQIMQSGTRWLKEASILFVFIKKFIWSTSGLVIAAEL